MSSLVGSSCPEVSAMAYFDNKIEAIDLSNFKKSWKLIYFYPGDFTFVCPTELAELASKKCDFDELKVKVFVISVDSPYVHKAWDDSELSKMINTRFPYPMLSDQDGSIGKRFGVYDERTKVDLRGAFIINPDDVIQAVTILVTSVGRSVSEIIRQIQALQFARESNEVCPASWKPGEKALIPGADLVGSVYHYWKIGTISDEGA
ncbi:peroxiredoxin (alkyl hydroperoxide reductase subunit C) [Thermodesulfobium acidiphilum]|uniref:Alkyl hydroperoxide reductase C n=1 Tax=Thermodesulfobium acidiphilum TaxID=1794699 RepID=A0A2R4VYC1_THEAF|nr:peroxiredoxin [Thermodesulfobium acidiphilum]AWB09460.1 peroxiredoxin (alkyl hydroperoxide reductase subunit C) [Thermodesulfobium acidiphilum]